jgi:regulatory protein
MPRLFAFLTMGKITALTAQVKNPDRVSVFIDGAFALGLALSVADGLRIGQEITPDELEQLSLREETHRARERALRLLARRPYSSAEIARNLRRHKVEDDIIKNVIDDLTEAKLIDDDAFAAYWVEQRETFRPRSRLALRQELSQRASVARLPAQPCPPWTRPTPPGGSRRNKPDDGAAYRKRNGAPNSPAT